MATSNPLERLQEQRAQRLLVALQDDLHAQMRLEGDELGRSNAHLDAAVRRKARITRLADPQERERIWHREELPSYEGTEIRSLPKTREFWCEVDVKVWRKVELDAACTLLDLPTGGKKLELIARIQDWVHEPEILDRLEQQRLMQLQQDGGFDANFAFALAEDGRAYGWGGGGRALFDDAAGRASQRKVQRQEQQHTGEEDLVSSARGMDGDSCFLLPRELPALSRRQLVNIACGRTSGHVAVASAQGECFTWGRGEYGELGTGSGSCSGKDISVEPLRVELLLKAHIAQVSVGNTHTAAISDKGRLFTWGSCWSGQLGLGTTKRAGVKDKRLELCFPSPTLVEALQSKRIMRVS
ncbi:hypothetical protein BBJ28_00022861, partial [Nothophytophthora sp. Chile5]